MGSSLSFTVVGLPAPQGSKKAFVHNGRAHLVESAGERVRSWRQDVIVAARAEADAMLWETLLGPVHVDVTFRLPRPKGHHGSGRNAAQVKASAPPYPSTKPDGDKLLRATLDALTIASVYKDDSQVVTFHVRKRYADDRPAGADISVREEKP